MNSPFLYPSVDIYDGDAGPVIFHGKTLTSKVSLRDVCLAIAKYAFVTSPYPIIISAEIHCSVAQQEVVGEIMRGTFGEALVSAPLEGRSGKEGLPSPEELRGRVLLKAKNKDLELEEARGGVVLQGMAAAGTVGVGTTATFDTESSSTENSMSDSEHMRGACAAFSGVYII